MIKKWKVSFSCDKDRENNHIHCDCCLITIGKVEPFVSVFDLGTNRTNVMLTGFKPDPLNHSDFICPY